MKIRRPMTTMMAFERLNPGDVFTASGEITLMKIDNNSRGYLNQTPPVANCVYLVDGKLAHMAPEAVVTPYFRAAVELSPEEEVS